MTMDVSWLIPPLHVAIQASTPLMLAALGEIYAERSGILNLGVEGMMLIGAITGFVITLTTGNPWLGMLMAAIAGALMAFIHAFVSISLQANQIISGLALTMLGMGISGLVGKPFIGIPLRFTLRPIAIPLLSDIPLLGPVFFKQDAIVYLSYILSLAMWFFLYRTKPGICIRAVGENPAAADAIGVNVALVRYCCTIIGGLLAGLGGAYISVVYIHAWLENMTAGRGWIALALVIFAMWDPLRALPCSYLFGGIEALQYWLQRYGINPYLLGALPYLVTILVLTLIGASESLRRRMATPSALGKPYAREERTA
ncbi:MAG: ABC transporter permease [Thermoprotei archaeon]|nr:ABC transporter permease [Thermoprotei archaeon]